MKRCGSICLFLFICTSIFSENIKADSGAQKSDVSASFFVNTLIGVHKYPSPYARYAASRAHNQFLFPVDLRFYFLRNHLGFGWTHFTSVDLRGFIFRYRSYHPMLIRNAKSFEEENIFFISYNFNLSRFQGEKLSPYFQINHGYAENAG